MIYSQHFSNSQVSELLLFGFQGSRAPDGTKRESAVWRKYARQEEDVHNTGEAMEDAKNARIAEKREKKGIDPAAPPDDVRLYYCGFLSATAGELRIARDDWYVDILHDIEGGIRSHTTVKLSFVGDAEHDTSARENATTEARRALARALRDPVPHVRARDSNNEHHPINRWGVDCLTVS